MESRDLDQHLGARRSSSWSCLAALCLLAVGLAPTQAIGSTDGEELIRAAGDGDLRAVQGLLAAGVGANSRSSRGDAALTAAAAGKHLEVVRVLLEAGARPNYTADGWTALFHAVTAGKFEMAELLLKAGADPDIVPSTYAGGRNALMVALSSGDARMARLLMASGANVNATTNYGATPLWFATWYDRPEHLVVTRELLQKGAAVDAGQHPRYQQPAANKTALAADGIVEVAGIASMRNAEGTVLGGVAASGRIPLMRLLLEAGAKVDARQPGWRTPLMLAAAAGKVDAVRLLLDAGADVTATDSDGRNALAYARLQGKTEVIRLLEAPSEPGAR